MNERPKGSVDLTRFNELVRESFDRPITVYIASYHFASFTTHVMRNTRIVVEQADNDSYKYIGFLWDGRDKHTPRSLGDLNLPLNQYNDWFLFEEVEAAVRFALGKD